MSTESLVGCISNKQLVTLYSLAKTFEINDITYVKDEILPKYLSYDPELVMYLQKQQNSDIKALGNNIKSEIEYYPIYDIAENPKAFDNVKDLIKWLKENEYALLPNGLIVDQKKDDAIIASVVDDITSSRNKYKKQMKEYLAKKDMKKYEVYDVYQRAVKVLANSVYGVCALEKFRLFDVQIADGITTTGQLLIRASTYLANKYLNELSNTENIDYVLANDTDSIIFTLKGIIKHPITERRPEVLAEISNYSIMCQDYINESIYFIVKNIFYKHKISKTNNYLSIKNEWLADAGLFVAKKMYAIHMVYNEGIPYETLKSTGISLRRASTPAPLKPFLKNVLENILAFKDQIDIDLIIIDECRKLKEEYRPQDIAIPSSLNDISKYKNLPVHVRGINIWNNYYAVSELDKLTSGKIKYLYVKKWNIDKLNIDREYVISVPNENKYWGLIDGKLEIDYTKMKDRLIIKPVDSFYSSMGWQLPTDVLVNHNNIFDVF